MDSANLSVRYTPCIIVSSEAQTESTLVPLRAVSEIPTWPAQNPSQTSDKASLIDIIMIMDLNLEGSCSPRDSEVRLAPSENLWEEQAGLRHQISPEPSCLALIRRRFAVCHTANFRRSPDLSQSREHKMRHDGDADFL